jgi:chromosome segregation protein
LAGRVGFLLLDNAGQTSENIKPVEFEGYISSVADLIDCMDYLKPVVKKLFANIAVFETGKIPEGYCGEAVDLDSNYYNHIGIIEGGRSDVSLIGRKDELSDLQDLFNSLKIKQDSFEQSLHQCQSSLSECNKDISLLDEKKRTLLSERESLLTDLTRLEFEFKENDNRHDQLSSDRAEAGKQSETLNHQKNEIDMRIAENETRLQELGQRFHQMSGDHRALVNDYESASKELNRLRLQSVELSGLLQKLKEDEKRTSELIDEAKKMIDQKFVMIDAEHVMWQKLENQEKEIKVQLVKVSEVKENIENDKINLNNEKNRLAGQISESEGKLKNLRQESGNISEEIHQKELKLADLKNSLNSIEENIFGEYGIRVTGILEEGYDESLINSEAERLENIIERVGPVNMLADEEYNNEKDRLEFLESQYADLQEAKSSLKDAIRKINQTAKEKFADTFELIRVNFQKVFETLFEGGIAEVRLTEPDNLLESPIEITARPKGKRLVSVNQLSGGERALTAISLLFAIYMVKPSPFCILDEIDAPLDDANISRFLKLINKFTQTTQFVVITHNKKTMETAGILYGVTTPGVSSIVSVKFDGNRTE